MGCYWRKRLDEIGPITHQNLNSGKRLINGRNSSSAFVGREGPSSSVSETLVTTFGTVNSCNFITSVNKRSSWHTRINDRRKKMRIRISLGEVQ